eukprot:GGOE01022938.1.p1 GENE.GGOE01022938.1~~GGOE01022938.1.p1  ORF type:complete len:792 (-),score=142.23 GGOE01022938.1:1007-3382(-)
MADESESEAAPTEGVGGKPEPSSMASQTEDETGRFVRSDKKLACGCSKVVYVARDEEEGVDVAWNELAFRASEAMKTKFQNEIAVLEGLEHSNILKCTTHFHRGEKIIFITEMMPGGTLKNFILQSKNHRLKLRVTQKICRQLLRALEYLHDQDPPVIHSELKCDNIFIDGHNCEVKLGDFGLSGRLGNIPITGHQLEFMAPEAMEGNYTCKGDVYSFGMCVLEMVTGQKPYAECRGNEKEIRERVATGRLPQALNTIAFDEYRIHDGQIRTDAKEFISLCLAPYDLRPTSRELLSHPFIATTIPPEGPLAHQTGLRSGTPAAASSSSILSSSSPSPVASTIPLGFPTSPQSPIVGCAFHSDSASTASHPEFPSSLGRTTQTDLPDHERHEAEEHDVLPSSMLGNTSHRKSWPCLNTRAKGIQVLQSSHPKFASSPEKLDTLGEEQDSRSGHALSNLPGLRPANSCPVSLKLTREDLSQWIHGTDYFATPIGNLNPGYGSGPDSDEEDLPPSLNNMVRAPLDVLETKVTTPSDSSTVYCSDAGHSDSLHSPSANGHLSKLCCETGSGTAIQRLVDEEQEVLQLLAKLEREHQEKMARFNSQFKRFEEDFKKQGLGIPPTTVAKPPPSRKVLLPHRDSSSSTSPLPSCLNLLSYSKSSGSDLDTWEACSPPASMGKARGGSPLRTRSFSVGFDGPGARAPDWVPGTPAAPTTSTWLSTGDGVTAGEKQQRLFAAVVDAQNLMQNAFRQLDGSLCKEVDTMPAPFRPKSPLRTKSPLVRPKSPNQGATMSRAS